MTVDIVRSGGIVEEMTIEEFSRWMCLMEAFHYINLKASELKKDVGDLLNSKAIDDYIRERYHSMFEDVKKEVAAGIL